MSPLQLGFLLGAFLVPWLLWALGARLNSRRFERICCWSIALPLLAVELTEFFVKLFTEDTPLVTKLPMHLCDWALFITVASLIWRTPRCFEIAYFWGLAGTMQGLLTPAIGEDLALWRRLGFFVIHAGIVAGIIYLILAVGMRPEPRSLWRVFLWSEFYFVLAQVLNALTGQNYGFLAHRPPTHSLLDLFPDNHWLYITTINLVALFAFALLYLPWWIVDRRRAARPQPLSNAGATAKE
jgi:hypothetical integral membrane protein (TIGR02206 family)